MRATSWEIVRHRGWPVVTAGLALILVGGFMPWLRSGRAWRNSYDVVRTADRLGLVADGYQSVLAVCWYLVPLFCGLTLTAIVLDRHWLAHLGSAAIAGLAALMAAVAMRARLPSGRGPEVAALGAFLVIAGSLVAAADRRARRPGATDADDEFAIGVTQMPRRWRRSTR